MDRKTFYFDLAERAAWTFSQGFAAFWIVTGAIDGETLVGGAVAGAISVAKSLVAVNIGDRGTASTLPESMTDQG
jgi:hypothetical protein